MLIASCQLLFFKDHAPTAWAGVGQEKPVLNDVILSFFIRLLNRLFVPYQERQAPPQAAQRPEQPWRKKEAAAEAARTAGRGDWGDDLQ